MQVRDFDLHFCFSSPGFVSHHDHCIPGNETNAKNSLWVGGRGSIHAMPAQPVTLAGSSCPTALQAVALLLTFLHTGSQAAQSKGSPQCLTASSGDSGPPPLLPSSPTENSHLDMASTRSKLHHQFIGYLEKKNKT